MRLIAWDKLPEKLKNNAVKPYYEALQNRKYTLVFKRAFDIVFSVLFILFFCWLYIIIAFAVGITSGFPVFYKQERITTYGKSFKVLKFRTMVKNADKLGSLVTVDHDPRITKVGAFLRKLRLDELPQIFNVLFGTMSFVGTRPEVSRYVDKYTDEMLATLLLPAGVTSLASIKFKDEAELLEKADDVDRVYINEILPQKMKYNLKYLENVSVKNDFKLMFKTVAEVLK